MNTKISEIINEIKKNVLETEQEEAVHGSHFNIFSILQIERKEVETHSTFIYELLNPHGSHRKKDLFLKLFIENVLKLTDYGEIIRVNREDPTSTNRRIDFVIETKNFIIGIEMKIDAGDQYKQLSDYDEELKKRKNRTQDTKLFYLTKFGDYASDDSRKNLIVGKNYHILSFRDHIDEWIDLCIQAVSKQQTLKEGLVQYKNLIHKITDKGNKKMENSLHEIVNSVDDIKAIDAISKSYPLLWAKKELEFWMDVESKLESKIGKKLYTITYPKEFLNKGLICANTLIHVRTAPGKERKRFGIYITRPIKNTNYFIQISVLYDQYQQKILIDSLIRHQDSNNIRENNFIREIKDDIKVEISKIRFYQLKEPKLSFELFDSEYFANETTSLVEEIVEYMRATKRYDKQLQDKFNNNKTM